MTIPVLDPELGEEIASLGSEEIEHLRIRGKNSLFFMAKGILGMRDVHRSSHEDFCKFIESHPADRRLSLMPRLTLKTSIGNEADCIRLSVRDPDHERILIVNEVSENADDILRAILGHFERNETLRFLYRDVIPERFTGPGVRWSTDGANLVRRTSYKEPNFMTSSIEGTVVSKHFTRIKGDDLIGLKAARSAVVMKAAFQWIDNVESLIVGEDQTIIDFIGTHWRRNDAYSHIKKTYGNRLAVFRRLPIENGELVFPQKLGWKQIEQLMKKPEIWAAQYMNDPQSDAALDFRESDLRYFKFGNGGEVVYSDGNKWQREQLDRVVTCDPNSGSKTAPDEAAIGATGVAPNNDMFSLYDWGGRPSPTELVDILFDACMRIRPRVVGIEEAGQQNTIHYFEKKMRQEGIYFRVEPLKHRNRVKEERIRTAMEPIIAAQRLYLQRHQAELKEQIVNYPGVENDDRIDRMAYAVELHRTPMDAEQQKKNTDAVKKVLARRNRMTGY